MEMQTSVIEEPKPIVEDKCIETEVPIAAPMPIKSP